MVVGVLGMVVEVVVHMVVVVTRVVGAVMVVGVMVAGAVVAVVGAVVVAVVGVVVASWEVVALRLAAARCLVDKHQIGRELVKEDVTSRVLLQKNGEVDNCCKTI